LLNGVTWMADNTMVGGWMTDNTMVGGWYVLISGNESGHERCVLSFSILYYFDSVRVFIAL